MKLDEKWIREHLPEECRDEPINRFSGLYLDGLTVMSEGERGEPAKICYEAKDEEDLNRWFLIPHWGYDYENLCFTEVSDSREYSSDSDKTEEINPECIIRVED